MDSIICFIEAERLEPAAAIRSRFAHTHEERMIASLTNLVSIKRVAAVMVFSVIACTASGQQSEQKPTTIAELRNAIEAVLHETHTPGAGIAIVSRDEIVWAAGLGVADVVRKRATTAETL